MRKSAEGALCVKIYYNTHMKHIIIILIVVLGVAIVAFGLATMGEQGTQEEDNREIPVQAAQERLEPTSEDEPEIVIGEEDETSSPAPGSEVPNNNEDQFDNPKFDRDDVVGLSESEAEALASQNDVPFRVGMRDGEPLAVTFDYRPGRITATIENNVVTNISVE